MTNDADSFNLSPIIEIDDDNDDINKIIIKPGKLCGEFFQLRDKLATNQQRERIAVCPPSNYPCLVGMESLNNVIIVVDTIVWNVTESTILNITRVRADTWDFCKLKESHVKTPDQLSNQLDDQYEYERGTIQFFFHWKFYVEKNNNIILLDNITSNLFRTVSHSKQCDSKRRPDKKNKRRRRSKKIKIYTANSSDDDYEEELSI